jgi:starvation-inducible DNA-binding protein
MPRLRLTQVIPHLRREQANAVQLYLQYKGYHWNVAGPMFRELHLLFDEHATKVLETVDVLAERQRMLGAAAPYTSSDLRAESTIAAEPGLPGTTWEMVERLLAAHRVVIDGMHEGFKAAEQEGDPGSADVFARFVQEHQKMEWFLRELTSPVRSVPDEAERLVVPAEKGTVLAATAGPHAPAPVPGRRSGL